jgi:hypothetical protein
MCDVVRLLSLVPACWRVGACGGVARVLVFVSPVDGTPPPFDGGDLGRVSVGSLLCCEMHCGKKIKMRPLFLSVLLPSAAALAVAPNLDRFLALKIVGLGRYGATPAVFLQKRQNDAAVDAGLVLPITIPFEAMVKVLLHGRSIVQRDGGVYDQAPWRWAPSPQAKQNAFSRFTGRGYPAEGYPSPYHMLLDSLRRDCCADVTTVLIENTDLLGSLVLGGALLVERRPPQSGDSGSYAAGSGPPMAQPSFQSKAESELCECTPDEAIGLALAIRGEHGSGGGSGEDDVDDAIVRVEQSVWSACCVPAQYSMQRGKMRVYAAEPTDAPGERTSGAGTGGTADFKAAVPLPWEITSVDELVKMSREDRARSALAAGMRLPRARDASEESLTDLLLPLLDEDVRRQVRVRRALDAGDLETAAFLDSAVTRRGRLLAALRDAVESECYAEAADLAAELRIETERRQDFTQDEGAYDRFLDQDDWYARDQARARERELEKERRRIADAE